MTNGAPPDRQRAAGQRDAGGGGTGPIVAGDAVAAGEGIAIACGGGDAAGRPGGFTGATSGAGNVPAGAADGGTGGAYDARNCRLKSDCVLQTVPEFAAALSCRAAHCASNAPARSKSFFQSGRCSATFAIPRSESRKASLIGCITGSTQRSFVASPDDAAASAACGVAPSAAAAFSYASVSLQAIEIGTGVPSTAGRPPASRGAAVAAASPAHGKSPSRMSGATMGLTDSALSGAGDCSRAARPRRRQDFARAMRRSVSRPARRRAQACRVPGRERDGASRSAEKATMRATAVPGVWSWSRWQPDRNLDFNGFFVESAEGNFVVDPIAPDEAILEALRGRGVADVVLTNRDHERAAAEVVRATGARVAASAAEAPLFGVRVDRMLHDGDHVHGWRVLSFSGCKTAGEIGLFDRARRTAIVGDVLWGTPAGALTFMPDAKLAHPEQAVLSLRSLRALEPRHLLVGDGACVFGNAHEVLGAAIDERDGIAVNRINLDELSFVGSRDEAPPWRAAFAEVGLALGARKLGYAVGRLKTGDHYCPYHWHTQEEELFVVLAGTPTLRTPRGTWTLRTGDMVAFPTDPGGAHRLWNDAADDALVLMIANVDRGDVCFYPDSRKFVVEATDTLVRQDPQLDYFEGER